MAIIVLASAFFSLYITSFISTSTGSYLGGVDTCLQSIPLFVLTCCLVHVVLHVQDSMKCTLYKYRYLVCLALFSFCVFFQLSESSISCWADLVGSSDDGVLWGIPRGIRSDEWAINMPSYLSQEQNGFQPLNSMLRGAETDVTLLPSLPSWALIDLFKPAFWGFLLFGAGYGVSWYWSLRVIALLIVTFDCFVLWTNNKWVSAAAALIVVFSPYAQWWGCFDVLLYGQMLVLFLHFFLFSERRAIRVGCAVGMAWGCGCYLFIAYPAWIAPCFYVFALLGVWEIIRYRSYRKRNHLKRWLAGHAPEALVLVISLMLGAVAVAVSFSQASLAIEGLSNTIYPGERKYHGGDGAQVLFDWIASIFYGLDEQGSLFPNACERSAYFALFPVGLIISLIIALRKRDAFVLSIVILDVVFLVFMIFGLPDLLSSITLLDKSLSNRMMLPIGFLDTLLLAYAVTCLSKGDAFEFALHKKKGWYLALICTGVALAVAICMILKLTNPDFWRKLTLVLVFLLLAAFILCLLLALGERKGSASKLFCISMAAILLSSGMCVNPIQRGVGVLADSEIYQDIERIADGNPDALWIAEGPFILSNLCASAGARTLTSTNTYPNLDMWATLDPNGDQEDIYLRYMNIDTEVLGFGGKSKYELLGGDHVKMTLTPQDLAALDVSYLLTSIPHDDTDSLHFEEIDKSDNMIIYRLDYMTPA